MSKKKSPRKPAQNLSSLVRSSALEYLTFIAASGQGGVEAVHADENIWVSQRMMAQRYDVDVRTINYHLKKVFADSELQEDSVIRNFRTTAADGTDRAVPQDAGKVSAKIAEAHAESEFGKYRIVQDRLFESDFDRALRQIECDQPPPAEDEDTT